MDEHDTKLTEQQMHQQQIEKIISKFGEMPPEQQGRILKRVMDGMGEIIANKIKEIGDELKETLPALLEILQDNASTERKE